MDRRRALTIGLVVATAGAAAAVTIPAVATTRGAAPGAPEPELLSALQRDLGLTQDQARTRLTSERSASRTIAELKAGAADAWGGAWLSADATRLTVAVTDPALAERVRAAGAEPKVVSRSAADLDTVKRTLDQNADAATPNLPGWYVDVADNTVVVLAQKGGEAAAREFATDAGAPASSVRVVSTEEAPTPFFDVRGADPFFIDSAARCSIGFSVVGGFVTAGHCGEVGATTTGFNQEAQGTFTASSFPGDDWGVVEVNGDWTPRPVVNDFNGGEVTVAGAEEAPVGASICRSGSTTGTRCGVVQAKNATVNYPEGTVTGLTRTDVCAEPGDSGGSWMSGDQAQGVTSGGSGDCTVGGITFFQPLTEILEVNQLTLVTSNGEVPPPPETSTPPTTAPPAPEPPAANACADEEVTVAGELSRTGARQSQPNGRFFRTGGGEQTACLDGPDGTDFDLSLQRWNGQSWQTVARATGAEADETLTFDGDAGIYRYRVQSRSGSGEYTLGFSTP
ncbi:S1 family peptidase [Phytohabitans sp. ZYX-F-186]|uniref:S1 family peptidase n=1 Tax=Phytohabitans maris TaxID=3071409 RepID=A0ABU0ZN45_9ACTN|nr:S1 family peptidase [Phytohabitans sp. ZYX-F-186]MDQ7907357.1 S1 family peptidase [Phytohabitans sp. ZYX-F-186]